MVMFFKGETNDMSMAIFESRTVKLREGKYSLTLVELVDVIVVKKNYIRGYFLGYSTIRSVALSRSVATENHTCSY